MTNASRQHGLACPGAKAGSGRWRLCRACPLLSRLEGLKELLVYKLPQSTGSAWRVRDGASVATNPIWLNFLVRQRL